VSETCTLATRLGLVASVGEGESVDAVGEQPEDQISEVTSPAAVALTVAAQLWGEPK